MAVPSGGFSASDSLGLGGALQAEVKGESEEERKKRMRAMQQAQMGASPAVSMLLGPRGALGA